jgi:hypothetical protein
MGAALTYARRYALFTLVGIAGEIGAAQDPELASPPWPNGQPEPKEHVAAGHANGSRSRKRLPPPNLLLPDASAILREQLLSNWWPSHRSTRRRRGHSGSCRSNTLTPDDADIIERAFRAKMQSVEGMGTASTANRGISNADPPPDSTMISDAPKLSPVEEEDQGAAARMKPVRKRIKRIGTSCVRNPVSSAAGVRPMPITSGLAASRAGAQGQ